MIAAIVDDLDAQGACKGYPAKQKIDILLLDQQFIRDKDLDEKNTCISEVHEDTSPPTKINTSPVLSRLPSQQLVSISVRNALTGNLITDVELLPSARVRDLERAAAQSVARSSRSQIIFTGAALNPTATLQDAGLHNGVEVLMIMTAPPVVVTGSSDGTAKMWNSETGACTRTLHGHTGRVNSVSFSRDGHHVKTTSSDRSEKTWNLSTGECENTRQSVGFISSASFSPDGSLVVAGSMDLFARIWNKRTGECERKLWGHTRMVTCASFSLDGKRIATGSQDCTAKIWDPTSGECLQTLCGHTELISSVAFSPDGRSVVTCSRDKTAKVWNSDTGACEAVLEGHTQAVNAVAFAPCSAW
mmetsp:Transcript_3532/g.6947  ORF Transcript_3532/g.6947 Transcript_3532/m.6947 type:complete len:360 (+) Transcript_3532:43-1122(+)